MEKPFQITAHAWHESRKPFIRPKTFHEYRLAINTLCKFFGDKNLEEITPQLVRDYQVERLRQCAAKKAGGHPAINHETGVLQQILRRHKLWADFKDDYKKLPLSQDICGRVLTTEEYDRLASLKLENTSLEMGWLLVMISLNTTAGPKELATLRLKDVDTENGVFFVQPEGAKNNGRIRTIPLNQSAMVAMKRALVISHERGASSPEHYVFPYRVKTGKYDPGRHADPSIKWAWNKIKQAAAIEDFNLYHCRHHAITGLLSDPLVSDETVEAIAGHVGPKMKKRYSHIRIQMKRDALDRINRFSTNTISEQPITNADVVEMLKHLPMEVVKAKIALSMTSCAFDTSIEAIKELSLAGVPKEVIVTMMLVPTQNTGSVPLEAMQWARLRPSLRQNNAVAEQPIVVKPRLRTSAYDREKLSKEVWEQPLIQVAPQYGLSGVALGKLCKRLHIPLPGRGYWAKKKAEVPEGISPAQR